LTIVLVTHDPRVAAWADRVVAIRDGQTSTETVRTTDDRRPTTDDRQEAASVVGGQPSVVEELVVLDRAGRLQLPGEQRALAGISRRARVELVDGGILIRPGDDDARGMGTTSVTSTGATDADRAYTSLYSTDPPRASNGNGRAKGKWRLWKKR